MTHEKDNDKVVEMNGWRSEGLNVMRRKMEEEVTQKDRNRNKKIRDMINIYYLYNCCVFFKQPSVVFEFHFISFYF